MHRTGLGPWREEEMRRGGPEGCKAGLTEERSFWKPERLPPFQHVLGRWARGWLVLCKDGCHWAQLSSLFTQPLPCVSLLLVGIGGPCHPLLPPVLLLTLTPPSSPSMPPPRPQCPLLARPHCNLLTFTAPFPYSTSPSNI